MTKEISITPFKNPSGAEVFRVSGWVNGKRRRENKTTREEAITTKQNWERELLNLAPLPSITTRLSSEQAAEAEAVYRRLQGQQLTLSQCVEYALENYTPAKTKKTVKDGLVDFLAEKKRANLRGPSLRTLRIRLTPFKTKHAARMIDSITADCIRPFIFRDGSGLVNQESDYRAFTNFFNWAKLHEFCGASPMDKIPTIKLDREEPEIMDVSEVRKFLSVAMDFRGGLLLPYVTLALFCAVRPAELSKLTWDDIDLEARELTIGSKVAKMRARRIVSISDNAARFLFRHAVRKPAFVGKNFRKHFDEIKRLAGWCSPKQPEANKKAWVPDILRHTGISFHLALHQHEGKTAAWAGNSPDVIQRHYKGLVKAKDAAEFWNITPEGEEKKIVLLPNIERLKMASTP